MESKTLVALGDSITYGYPYTPRESWVEILRRETEWRVINSGISGDTFNDMERRLEREVLSYKPQVVTLMGGTNDVYIGFSHLQIQRNFLSIMDSLLKDRVEVWIGLPLPVDDPAEGSLNNWRKWLTAYCREQNLILIDFHQDFIDAGGKIRTELLLDGCHPRRKGYEVMGKRIIKTLEELGVKK